jgi:hypothetical protein
MPELPPLEGSMPYGVSLESVKAREKLLVDALRGAIEALYNSTPIVPYHGVGPLPELCRIVAQFDAEDHQ